jgi:hypothetical protein
MRELILTVAGSPLAWSTATILAYSGIWLFWTQVAPNAGWFIRGIAATFWAFRAFVVMLGVSMATLFFFQNTAHAQSSQPLLWLYGFLICLLFPLGTLAALFTPYGLRRVFPLLASPVPGLRANSWGEPLALRHSVPWINRCVELLIYYALAYVVGMTVWIARTFLTTHSIMGAELVDLAMSVLVIGHPVVRHQVARSPLPVIAIGWFWALAGSAYVVWCLIRIMTDSSAFSAWLSLVVLAVYSALWGYFNVLERTEADASDRRDGQPLVR